MSAPLTLPENNSFIDISPPTIASSRNTSEASAVETPQTPPALGGVYLWEVGKGWQNPILAFPIIDPSLIAKDRVVATAKSDTHPDVVANLIAEFLTDTILRIDKEASVDMDVTLKQDLIVVTGQVLCSHPAKGAIIHSEQFLATLNASLRDVLRDIGFTHPVKVAVPGGSGTPPQAGGSSPKRQTLMSTSTQPAGPAPASPPLSSDQSEEIDDDLIDPSQVHIIIALTQATPDTIGTKSTVTCTASFSDIEFDCQSAARKIENALLQYRLGNPGAMTAAGGVVVEVHGVNDKIAVIDVSVNAKNISDRFISEMGSVVLTSESIKSLSPRVMEETIVVVRFANRSRDTGRSSPMCGKDWRNPLRYGHVLARQEAQALVQGGKCTRCRVDILFPPAAFRVGDTAILQVSVSDLVGCKTSSEDLSEFVKDRSMKRTPAYIRDSIITEQSASLFALNLGGSFSSHEATKLI